MNPRKRMWLELGTLVVATGALLVLLNMPIRTHAVVIPMPSGEASEQDVLVDPETFSLWIRVVFLVGIAAIVIWLARRIVRRAASRE